MRITAIETIHVGAYPNITFVEVHTDEGLIGLGETFRTPKTVAAQIRETVAPYLLGKDPLTIDAHSSVLLNPYLGFASTSAEIRAASAVDIALWDLWGKALGRPVHELLGGLTRDKIRVYNTCAGYAYNQAGGTRRVVTAERGDEPTAGPYDDQVAFTRRPAELAQSLLEMGITAMKIWPFDSFAIASGGRDISARDLEVGLEPFRKIRAAVGNSIDIMCEFHSLWNLPTAVRIADALAEYSVYWAEDPIKMVDLDALADYRRRVRIPVCASETLATRHAFRDLLAKQAVDYVMFDVGWCGGLSEAKEIAAMAEASLRPIAPHDCTGPVVLIASLHLALNAPNALFQEVVRAYYTSWYKELVTELPRIENGEAYAMSGPGLGTALLPDLRRRPDVAVQRSE
ncbi:MAG TPA: mandelate racemase/muconate lactonizing enzyme family protein [Casimicrobiaceae bacterium]|jgi:L-alanine-DL-glutamate epimerase-like enolase superfamily enzyme